jgi:hypothetical protein
LGAAAGVRLKNVSANPPFQLWAGTDQSFEIVLFLEHEILDKIQKPDSPNVLIFGNITFIYSTMALFAKLF